MPTDTTTTLSPLLEGLNIHEFAILEFTNDQDILDDKNSKVTLSAKGFYYWAVAISTILENNPEVDEEKFAKAYKEAINENEEQLRQYYSSLTLEYSAPSEQDIFRSILSSFINNIDPSPNYSIDYIIETTNKAYRVLVDKGLIEDPVEIAVAGILIAVGSLIPVGFTIKKENGRIVYTRIDTLFIKAEMEDKDGKEKYKFEFKIKRVLKTMKTILTFGYL